MRRGGSHHKAGDFGQGLKELGNIYEMSPSTLPPPPETGESRSREEVWPAGGTSLFRQWPVIPVAGVEQAEETVGREAEL